MPTQASRADAGSNSLASEPDRGRPRRREGLRTRVLGGEVLILDRRDNRIHQLNPTAAFIWTRCDGRHTAGELARALAQAFDVDPARTEADVATTVRQLETLGLLEVSTAPH